METFTEALLEELVETGFTVVVLGVSACIGFVLFIFFPKVLRTLTGGLSEVLAKMVRRAFAGLRGGEEEEEDGGGLAIRIAICLGLMLVLGAGFVAKALWKPSGRSCPSC